MIKDSYGKITFHENTNIPCLHQPYNQLETMSKLQVKLHNNHWYYMSMNTHEDIYYSYEYYHLKLLLVLQENYLKIGTVTVFL